MEITLKPIGIIHTPFDRKEACPIQSVYSEKTRGTIEVFSEHASGLKDIDGFSHIYLLYYFDRAGEIEYVRPTFLDEEPHGIYASRHPCRPNGIGMSIVKLIKIRKNRLKVEGVDVLNQTPLLDIKPYIPRFDVFESATDGWLTDKDLRFKPTGRE